MPRLRAVEAETGEVLGNPGRHRERRQRTTTTLLPLLIAARRLPRAHRGAPHRLLAKHQGSHPPNTLRARGGRRHLIHHRSHPCRLHRWRGGRPVPDHVRVRPRQRRSLLGRLLLVGDVRPPLRFGTGGHGGEGRWGGGKEGGRRGWSGARREGAEERRAPWPRWPTAAAACGGWGSPLVALGAPKSVGALASVGLL
jgi:hypothetical protein